MRKLLLVLLVLGMGTEAMAATVKPAPKPSGYWATTNPMIMICGCQMCKCVWR